MAGEVVGGEDAPSGPWPLREKHVIQVLASAWCPALPKLAGL